MPEAGQRLAFGVGHEVVRAHLHDVGLEESARLARAGSPHHEHVAVALVPAVVVGAAHRHAEALGQDDVLVGVLEVHEAPALAHTEHAATSPVASAAASSERGPWPMM